MNRNMHIVQVTAEFAPIAKAGGLGEVLVGLSRQLVKNGEKVEVILPKYDFISQESLHRLKQEGSPFSVHEHGRQIQNTMWTAEVEGCPLRLLETKHPENYFNRGRIYGFEDDTARFLYFSRAVLEYLKIKNEPIDILHLHDWHVSALAPLVKELHKEDIKIGAIALSIHNVEYQGICAAHDLAAIGLKDNHIARLHSIHPNQYNILKGGIEYADAIIPVSPSYAHEILTSPHGFGLELVLKKNKEKIQGILNGIDLHLWDPSKDGYLKAHYSASDSFDRIRTAKGTSRKRIAERFHLDDTKRPWIGAITRLVPQKGPELLEEALKSTIPLGGVFALLGSSPIPEMQTHFEQLKKHYKNHPQVLLYLDYDEALAHELYASLDFLLVPSHFEPCGLTQLISMHYGTVPIVRSTGGLKDTVFDSQNGFVFDLATKDALNLTLRRAFQSWNENPSMLQKMTERGMQTDFGWALPAKEYMQVFNKLLS